MTAHGGGGTIFREMYLVGKEFMQSLEKAQSGVNFTPTPVHPTSAITPSQSQPPHSPPPAVATGDGMEEDDHDHAVTENDDMGESRVVRAVPDVDEDNDDDVGDDNDNGESAVDEDHVDDDGNSVVSDAPPALSTKSNEVETSSTPTPPYEGLKENDENNALSTPIGDAENYDIDDLPQRQEGEDGEEEEEDEEDKRERRGLKRLNDEKEDEDNVVKRRINDQENLLDVVNKRVTRRRAAAKRLVTKKVGRRGLKRITDVYKGVTRRRAAVQKSNDQRLLKRNLTQEEEEEELPHKKVRLSLKRKLLTEEEEDQYQPKQLKQSELAEKHTCQLCRNSFSSSLSLQQHMMVKHQPTVNLSNSIVDGHQRPAKEHICQLCHNSFSSSTALNKHITKWHQPVVNISNHQHLMKKLRKTKKVKRLTSRSGRVAPDKKRKKKSRSGRVVSFINDKDVGQIRNMPPSEFARFGVQRLLDNPTDGKRKRRVDDDVGRARKSAKIYTLKRKRKDDDVDGGVRKSARLAIEKTNETADEQHKKLIDSFRRDTPNYSD